MKKHVILLFALLFLTISNTKAQTIDTFFTEANSFFSAYVSKGEVDYTAIHKNKNELTSLLSIASDIKVSPSEATNFQAFWINAYNLAVIKGIIDNYGINSPLDKNGFFDTTTYSLGGTKITLNDIENKMLRAKFDDARFHFVLVCGAKGCPPLIAEAYMPGTLDAQLQRQTKKALNDHSFIKVSDGKVAVSEIFKWYKEDFVKNGSEIDFINTFRKDTISENTKLTYYSYDWRLNSK
ncbi:DUF547 domain-containing protein [Jejudonia soesokkakensis]|uniref:DUF547 domain-containing protein n=1 Tax=Jejudonia soesokkakensis TaxID=1323432 RepID=A0ABW2MSZ0_9FLAO